MIRKDELKLGRCMHLDHAQPGCDCKTAPPFELADIYELAGDKGAPSVAKSGGHTPPLTSSPSE